MLALKIGTTIAVPLDLSGTTFGTYLKRIEEEHNVTMFSYDPLKNLIAYTGEIEALRWFIRKEINADWDDIEGYILTIKKEFPPLWNLMTFSDLLRHSEWNYTMNRLEGYVAPYQYKLDYDKAIKGQHIHVKIPWMRMDPTINIFQEENGELTLLETFVTKENYLPFEDVAKYLKNLS